MKLAKLMTAATLALSIAGLVAACGKSVEVARGTSAAPPDAGPAGTDRPPSANAVPDDSVGPCTDQSWNFTQPAAQLNRAVDLLIVADSSPSLSAERAQIASKLPAFLSQLDSRTDLRVGVMLAHGGASSWSGRLYSTTSIGPVQSTRTTSVSTVQSRLSKLLSQPASDKDEANGEAMLYSLSRATDLDRMREIQGQGLLRNEAALSIVTISDENDICYPPEQHGYTAFPDFVPSNSGWEAKAYARYCTGISPESVLAQLKTAHAGGRIALASITHVDPARVPPATGGSEDAIGHGLIEFTRQAVDGKLMDLADDWNEGLRTLGDVVSVQQRLNTSFALGSGHAVQPSSVHVRVDGVSVPASYDPPARSVEIAAAWAGQAGSSIVINGCVAN